MKSASPRCRALVHDYGKDGGMYIFPECVTNANWKLLNKDDKRSPNDEKFRQNKQIHLMPYVYILQKDIHLLS